MSKPSSDASSLRYSIDENPPALLSAGLGLQIVILIIGGIVLTPTIVLRAAGQSAPTIEWAIFACLIASGVITMLQAKPVGRFGSGFVLFMGTSGAFMAVSIDAISIGGLPLLASLVIASSLIQFVLSHNLSRLRSIVTPTVGGIVIMLIAVTVFPIAFKMINATPYNVSGDSLVGPAIAVISFLVILGISLFAKGALRLWGPIVGVIVGTVIAMALGAVDFSNVEKAAWFGLPSAGWPGIDTSFSLDFWTLLLPFVIVTIVSAIETYGDGVAIQHLSHRKPKPVDYKSVQGAVNADGLGNLFSGLLGTLPNTTYSTSLSVVDLTGVAARSVGVIGGAILVFISFSPKLANLLMAIPTAVAGAYIIVLLILLFLHGLRLVAEQGLDFENGMVVCVSFWLAIGFQDQVIFHKHMPDWLTGLLDNGMTAGGITAIILVSLLQLRQGKTKKIDLPFTAQSITKAQQFVAPIVARKGWNNAALWRLELALEEAITFLLQHADGQNNKSHLHVNARLEQGELKLELISGNSDSNFDSVLDEMSGHTETRADDAGLRILNSLAKQVLHQQFVGTDVLLLTMKNSAVSGLPKESFHRQ